MGLGPAFLSDRRALGLPSITSEQDARWNEWRTRYREIAPEDLRAAGAGSIEAARFALPLNIAMKKFEISNMARQAAFLANVAQETGDPRTGAMLGAIEESSKPYTVNKMREVFPRRFPDDDSIVAVLRRPRDIDDPDKRDVVDPVKFFNHVYGHRRDLGNRPNSDDGYTYRGRGVLGLTGRDRYIACGAAIGFDLAGDPDRVAEPIYGCLAGAWAWCEAAYSRAGDERHPRNLNLIADLDTPEAFDKTCAGVNHGDIDALRRGIRIGGLAQRRNYWPLFHHALHQRDLRLFHSRMGGVVPRNAFDNWIRPTVNDDAMRPRFLRDAVRARGVPR
jgi:putative chitinase